MKYVFEDPSDPSKLKIENRSHPPKNHYGPPPNDDDQAEWLELDVNGNVVVNTTKKESSVSAKAAAKTAKEQRELDRSSKSLDLLSLNVSTLNSIPELRSAILKIIDILLK